MGNPWEYALVIGVLSLWVLFPLGMFLSIHRLDQNSDQLFQIVKYREKTHDILLDHLEQKERKRGQSLHLPRLKRA